METKRFQRHIEDFHCAICNKFVIGKGYTNHCPNCLWSKHVDILPGDRSNPCKGMMKPVEVIVKSEVRWLLHQCEKCGEIKRIKVKDSDNFQKQLEIMHT